MGKLMNMQPRKPTHEQAMEGARTIIQRSYLERLEKLEVKKPGSDIIDIKVTGCGRLFCLERLVTNKDENYLDKLTTVFNAAAPLGSTITAIINSDGKTIRYYLGVLSKQARQDNKKDNELRQACADTFSGAVRGNFSGSTLHELSTEETDALCKDLFEGVNSIASVSGIVSPRNRDDRNTAAYVQGLENLTNSLQGKKYTIIIIADAVDSSQIRMVKQGYETLHSQLSVFQGFSITANESESYTLSESQSESITTGISEGINYSQFHSTNRSHTNGTSNSVGISANIGIPFITGAGVSGNRGWSMSDTEGSAYGQTKGTSKSRNESESTGTTKTSSSGQARGKSLQFSAENRTVKGLLNNIDFHLKRLDAAESFGAFECAAYILADSHANALSAAGHYNAIMRGDDSFVQLSSINSWSPNRPGISEKEKESFARITQYLESFSHPEFYLEDNLPAEVTVRPSSLVSGRELAIQFAMPKKSVHGLTVIEMTPFGRNVPTKKGRNIELGMLYYMGQTEAGKASVPLNVDSLAAHTFVTGSTGSGKSNTLYKMIHELDKQGVRFLVIEPAKGEYREVFGGRSDVEVFGTNPYKTPKLLQINPFSFPEDTHVLEHIDRLVEVFNACWPMYAAMPAILRESVERAYEELGWNLKLSRNPGSFPSFNTLLKILPQVITESGYSEETSSDYKGALVTRIRSLTRGIHGQVFSGDIEPDKMFNSNVIVDLSRIGSQETKSLIMGILVLKLQEFRMSEAIEKNSVLRHVTVLEEAHNLLKRTSGEQLQENSNLQGKSVEMLANSIVEMRTYGEGFIIADQSPGLLDMSVIRNTNTKIILKLPDESDRILVGKASGLSDEQVSELSRLERGVASVSQSDWQEPVLCSVDKFEDLQKSPVVMPANYMPWSEETIALKKLVSNAFISDGNEITDEEADCIRKWYADFNSSELRRICELTKEGTPLSEDDMLIFMREVTGRENLIKQKNCELTIKSVINAFVREFGLSDDEVLSKIEHILITRFPCESDVKESGEYQFSEISGREPRDGKV